MKIEKPIVATNGTLSNPVNKIIECIYSRRAVRKYLKQPVDKMIIEQVVDAGRMAPSAMNRQTLNFHVLTNTALIKSFSKQIGKAAIKGITKMKAIEIGKSLISALLHPHDLSFFKEDDFVFHGAPVVIFISAPIDSEWAGLDSGACAQNMMLAAKSLGLDTCPVGFAKFVGDTKMYSMLNIAKKEHVVLAVILGYGDEIPEVHLRKKDNLFFIEQE
ncbi:MAG: nitroreductase family protein [Bacteroidetes bacterium]|nr:nitroreductase family protein [Bacteroidota bacterium]